MSLMMKLGGDTALLVVLVTVITVGAAGMIFSGFLEDEARHKSAGRSLSVTEEAGAIMENTVKAAEGALQELNRAMVQIAKSTDAMQGIAAVAREQAASAEEMTAGVEQVSRSTADILFVQFRRMSPRPETEKAHQASRPPMTRSTARPCLGIILFWAAPRTVQRVTPLEQARARKIPVPKSQAFEDVHGITKAERAVSPKRMTFGLRNWRTNPCRKPGAAGTASPSPPSRDFGNAIFQASRRM
jgi:hypothetical protein